MADNLHSTVVAWLKVILPLAALALLSTLFLVARRIEPEAAIPFAEAELADRLRQPRLTAPIWSSVTENGSALTVTASEARPAGPGGAVATARDLVARLEAPGGGRTDIVSDRGTLDHQAGRLTLEANVVVITSTGYRMETPTLVTALDGTRVEGRDGVTVEGPLGRIEAQAMLLTPAEGGGAHVLRFTGDVKLIYRPAKELP